MFKNLKITTKIVLIIFLLTVVSIFAENYIGFKIANRYLKYTRITSLENIADLKVSKVETFFLERMGDIRTAQGYFNIKTHLPVISQYANDRMNPAYIKAKKALDGQLKTFQRAYGYTDVTLINPQGKVVYVSNEAHVKYDLDKILHGDPGSRTFEEGKKGICFSDIYKGKIESGRFEMLIMAPVTDFDGRFIGVISLEVNMLPIYEFIQETTGLGETGETLIGKRSGDEVLFLNILRHDKESALNRKVIFGKRDAYPIQEATQGRRGSGFSIDYRGKEVIAAWRHIPSVNWGLVVKIDVEEAFVLIAKLRKYTFLCALGLLFIAMIMGYFYSRTIITPLKKLSNMAHKIAKGNYDFRTDIISKDEVGLLAESINTMADSLQREIEERKASEEQFFLLAENIPGITWMSDSTLDKIFYISPAYEKIFGRTCESLYEKPRSFLEAIHPDDLEHVHAAIRGYEQGVYDVEYRVIRPDKSVCWIWAHALPLRNKEGKIFRMFGIAENITGRKKLEEELRGKIEELKTAQDSLVRAERLATIGRFAGSIAHDIRHPLTTIKNSSYFLNMTVKDADEKTKKHLKLITDEVSFANKIVTNLLDFSRIRKLERMKTDLNGFIREHMSEYLLPDGIKVAIELDNRCPEVMVDRTQIKQLLGNLVENAIDAMPEGGKLMIKTCYLSSVNSHLEKEKPVTNDQKPMTKTDFVEISFTDTGIGIKKEDIDKVFEPLFTSKQKGTGLGLSIVRNIVEAHGGEISVESEEGKGSKFTIAFPVVGH